MELLAAFARAPNLSAAAHEVHLFYSTQPGYRQYYEAMFEADKQHYIDASALTPEQLGRIKARILMMHGRQDVSFPPDDTCLVLARSLPADVWLINQCAHSVALECPDKFLAGADLLFR